MSGADSMERRALLRKGMIFVFALALATAAYGVYRYTSPPAPRGPVAPGASGQKPEGRPLVDPGSTPPARVDRSGVVEIGIAYGTEKRRWLTQEVEQFAQSPEGKGIRVKLIPMGSVESAHAILRGDTDIHVWSPASSMYREIFMREWQIKHVGDPIVKEEALALTPMVFVMWKKRYEPFMQKYERVSFETIQEAMETETGWGGIAGKPNWGLFKFGYTQPNKSNSGLMTLILMAYDSQGKTTRLKVEEIMDPDLQARVGLFARGAAALSNSTGNLMREMVLKGPSFCDALMVYESVVIDYLKNAEDRWDELRVVYPPFNVWNDNPYYVLGTDWCTEEHRRAAEAFLAFLMSEPAQTRSMNHGFRPGNPRVPVRFPESPFVIYEKYGMQIDVERVCQFPPPEVIENLQQSWLRAAEMRGL